MREYPNVLKKSLENDTKFNIELSSAINKLFDSQAEPFFKNDEFEVKLINVDSKNRYMIVKDSKYSVMAVYHENIHEYNTKIPFSYEISALKEHGNIYASRIISFPISQDEKAERKKYVKEMYEKFGMDAIEKCSIDEDELLDTLTDRSLMRYREGLYATSYSPYEMKNFCNFIGVKRDSDFWVKHSEELNDLLKFQISDILISLAYMQDIAKEQNFTSKNRFDYNDLDNHLWSIGKGIALDDQNLGFYCVMNDRDLIVYGWDRGNNNSKKHTELKDLMEDIESNKVDLIDHVVLKIENGKATFVDNALIYSLVLDIQCTKNELVDEGYGEPKYPVDIYSFNYQLAYYRTKHKYDEFSFMDQAIMTLGSGFDYNEETGRFYDSSVIYDSNIIIDYQPEVSLGKAINIYGYPKEFTKLDEDWTAAIKRMLNVLKVDRPMPIGGDTPAQKNKKLDEIISFYEKRLEKLENKPKNKM